MLRFLPGFAIGLLLLQVHTARSQTKNFNYVPPTPDATALHKFTEIPVGHFTGVPNIGIDLFAIELEGFSVPFSLSYHAGGFRVEEVAGNTGLGWSLSGAGNVSASVSDFYDLGPFGFVSGPRIPQDRPLDVVNDFNDYQLVMEITGSPSREDPTNQRHKYDTEPDIFFYSYPGGSGKFVLDQQRTAHPIPYDEIDISVDSGNSTFTVVDARGNTFEFDRIETNWRKTLTFDNNDVSGTGPDDFDQMFTYSFQLTKITTRYGETVEYFYEKPLEHQYKSSQSFTRHARYPDNTCEVIQTSRTETYDSLVTSLLTRIVSSRGHEITYSYSSCDRADLKDAYALVSVQFKYGEFTKQYDFDYGYFGPGNLNTLCTTGVSDPANYRLKLKTLTEQGKPPYVFDYNNTYTLPNRLSYSQDSWGYFNGKSNSMLLPIEPTRGFFEGADRSVSASHAQAGILTSITYPTGGNAKFRYEANDTQRESETIEEKKGVYSFYGDANMNRSFTVGQNAMMARVSHNAITGTDTLQFTFTLTGPNGFSRIFDTEQSWYTINLPAGDYQLEVHSIGTSYDVATFRLEWGEKYTISNSYKEPMGGLRVSAIEYEFSNHDKIKRFYRYENPSDTSLSTGKFLWRPEFSYSYTKTLWNEVTQVATGFCNYYAQTSSSNMPLSGVQGSPVGYTKVIEMVDSLGISGTVVREFSFRTDMANESSYPLMTPITFDWMRGKPVQTSFYKGHEITRENLLKKEKSYYYDNLSEPDGTSYYWQAVANKEFYVVGLKIEKFRDEGCNTDCCAFCPTPALFDINAVKVLSVWSYLQKQETYEYAGINDSTVTTVNYYYDQEDTQLDSLVRHFSDTHQAAEYYYTPLDFAAQSTSASSFIQKMKDKHILADQLVKIDINRVNNKKYIRQAEVTVYDADALRPSVYFQLEQPDNPQPGIVPQITFGYSGQPVFDSEYRVVAQYTYRSNGLVDKAVDETSGLIYKFLWSDQDRSLIAFSPMESEGDIAYTSFEAGQTGNWLYDTAYVITSVAGKTGQKSYDGTSPITRTIPMPGDYTISMWAQKFNPAITTGNDINVNGSVKPVNGSGQWEYLEWTHSLVQGQTVSITPGSNIILDEIRLHPAGTYMTTFTHRPGYGISSSADPNVNARHYDYDTFGRLIKIKDPKGNNLKSFEYHYKTSEP